jgi:hypothetical protein
MMINIRHKNAVGQGPSIAGAWGKLPYLPLELGGPQLNHHQLVTKQRVRMTAFWDMVLCSLAEDWHFRSVHWLQHQGDLASQSTSMTLHSTLSQKAVILISSYLQPWEHEISYEMKGLQFRSCINILFLMKNLRWQRCNRQVQHKYTYLLTGHPQWSSGQCACHWTCLRVHKDDGF